MFRVKLALKRLDHLHTMCFTIGYLTCRVLYQIVFIVWTAYQVVVRLYLMARPDFMSHIVQQVLLGAGIQVIMSR